MKGRRLALLLAGALPLLADEHDASIGRVGEKHPHAQAEESLHVRQAAIVDDTNDENDQHHNHDAAEALHDDSLRKLPALNDMDVILDEPEAVKPKASPELVKESEPIKNDASSSATVDEAKSDPVNDRSTDGSTREKDPDVPEDQKIVTTDNSPTQPLVDASEVSQEDKSTEKSERIDNDSKGEDSSIVENNQEDKGETSTNTNNSETATEKNNHKKSSSDDNATAQDEHATEHTDTNPDAEDASSSTTKDQDTTTGTSEEEEDVLTERLVVDYASKSAGALILEKSPAMKGTSNLLNSDKDKYAIAPCEEKKVVVISLSEDILVEQVKLANYERYSSRVEEFQILGSQDMANWEDFGNYKAHSGNGEQTFQLTEPSWARYIKFRFLSHFGDEYYCTVSQIKVHGKTNLQDFTERKQREESEQALLDELVDDDDEDNGSSASVDTIETQDGTATDGDAQPGSSVGKTQVSSSSNSANEASINSNEGAEKKLTDTEFTQDGTPSEEAHGADTSSKSEGSIETETKESVHDPSSSEEDLDQSGDSINGTTSNLSEGSTDSSNNNQKDLEERTNEEEEVEKTATSDDAPCSAKKEASCKQGRKFDSNLPDALMNFQWEGVLETSIALSTASIERSASERATEPRMPAPETLDIHAIRQNEDVAGFNDVLKGAVHEVLAQASDYSISDAIKDLKEKMRITIETTIGKVDSSSSSSSSPAPTVGTASTEQTVGQKQKSIGQIDAPSNEDGAISGGNTASEAQKDTHVPAQGERSENLHSDPESSTATVENPETNHHAVTDDVNVGLARILKRFPSAECLENLNYSEFKAKIISKAKAKPGSSAPTTGGHVSGGRNEPIFKTLTDEIRTLQINQSVNDQFTKALVSCYQRVLLDMSAEMESLQANQAERLSQLELMVQEMKTQSMTNQFKEMFKWIISIVSIGTIQLFALVFSILEDPNVHAAVADVLERIKRIDLIRTVSSTVNWIKSLEREDITDLVESGETEQMKVAGAVLVILVFIRLALRAKKSAQKPKMPPLIKIEESVTKMDPPEEIKDIQEAEQVETIKSTAKVQHATEDNHDENIDDSIHSAASTNSGSHDGDRPSPKIIPAVVAAEQSYPNQE